MTVSSLSNLLTPQQLLQLLQQESAIGTDTDSTDDTTATAADGTGQNVPAGTTAQPTADTANAASAQAALDPDTVIALLKIQESRSLNSADALLLGGDSSDSSNPLGFTGLSTSGSTGDPLLDALNGNSSSGSDDAFNALMSQVAGGQAGVTTPDPTAASLDPADLAQIQSMLDSLTGSTSSTGSMTDTTQNLLDFLNGTDAATSSQPADQATADQATLDTLLNPTVTEAAT